MTSRERVLRAARHDHPDRTPMDFGGTQFSCAEPEVLRGIRDILGLPMAPDRDPDGVWPDEAIQRAFGADLRWIPPEPPMVVQHELFPDEYQKALRRRHETTAAGHQEFPLAHASEEEIRRIAPRPQEPSPFLAWQQELAREYRDAGFAVTMSVHSGYFEMGCWQRGYDRFALDLALNERLVRHLFDVWAEEKRRVIDNLVAPMAPYVDIFCFGDDLGMQSGPFLSPEMFRDTVKPYIRATYGLVKKVAPESLLFHHSCGSVLKLLDDLIECGIDILNPIQPKAADMTPEQLKDKGRGRISYHGGIDLQELLPHGSADQIRGEVAWRMSILGDGGGYICAPAHIVPIDVPASSIVALFDTDGIEGTP